MARRRKKEPKGELLLLTGVSGAGKTLALHTLEDIGFYCVDNLPPSLLPGLLGKVQAGRRVAAVIDSRAEEPLDIVEEAIRQFRQVHVFVCVLFLDCADEVLQHRFKETRRPHPLSKEAPNIERAIALERERLAPLRALATQVMDTTMLRPQELRALMTAEFASEQPPHRLRVRLVSFGYKFGVPADADLVFDARFLVNPYYVPDLKPRDGTDPEVENFVLRDGKTQAFLEKQLAFLGFALPEYEREGKAYLTIAVGCTGGRHRSVVLIEQLRCFLEKRGYPVTVYHRDVEKDKETD